MKRKPDASQLCETATMIIILIAIASYLLAARAVILRLTAKQQTPNTFWLLAALFALSAHLLHHGLIWRNLGAPDLHFAAAISLVAFSTAVLTTFYASIGRAGALGVVVFPLAAMALAGYAVLPGNGIRPMLGWRLELHAAVALLAYATLTLAALLALMLWVQERALRRHAFHRWLRLLPPMAELETLMFQTIRAGFVLLSMVLLTGVLFIDDFFRQRLTHKTVLSVLSWLTFGALLLGRWRHGWRGITAVHWTLAAMALLMLAFFGSKFVYEILKSGVA